jgi:threonine dehydratase
LRQDINRYPADLPATPLVPVQLSGEEPVIWCKLEFLNPSGSTKDRIARYILGNAFRCGRVKPGDAVIEASSGSTSIAMALFCAQLNLRFTAVLPEGVSNERRSTIPDRRMNSVPLRQMTWSVRLVGLMDVRTRQWRSRKRRLRMKNRA